MARKLPIDIYTQLLLRAQGGDPQAFGKLFAALKPTVMDFVTFLDGQLCMHEREDIVHEAFVRAWENLASFRGDASAKTFLLAIAKNVLLKDISKRRKLPILYVNDVNPFSSRDAPSTPTSSSGFDPDAIALTIRQAMARLTEAQRQAVELDQFQDMPQKDAAKLANCTPGQFADRLYRARKHLRQMLKGLIQYVLL